MSKPTKEQIKADLATGRAVRLPDILDSGGELGFETDDDGKRTDVIIWPDEVVPFSFQAEDNAPD